MAVSACVVVCDRNIMNNCIIWEIKLDDCIMKEMYEEERR